MTDDEPLCPKMHPYLGPCLAPEGHEGGCWFKDGTRAREFVEARSTSKGEQR